MSDLLDQLEPLHPRNNTIPGEVFLGLAADALAWSGISTADPLPLEGDPGSVPSRVLQTGRDWRPGWVLFLSLPVNWPGSA